MISAGSPGSSCCRPKISIDTSTSVGMICSSRWVRKASKALLHFDADDADEAIRHLLIALDPVAERDQHAAVIEIDDGALGQELARHDFIALLAVGGHTLGARLQMRGVDLLVAILAVVLRRVAGLEDVGVAVGIDTAAPADEEQLELAILGLLERGC